MTDVSLYAGRWIALTESDTIASVGTTLDEARCAGRVERPKERLRLVWVSPHPPHMLIPEWPLVLIRPYLPTNDVWLAGGPVRDLLLRRPLHDWDFAVRENGRALARRVANGLDAAYYTLDAERDTGRVVVEEPATRQPITLDFATLRGATLHEDLVRRDFTINAMAMTLAGQIVDPTGGQEDLQRRLIRATRRESFRDDPARLLRALRQAAALNFQIESETARWIREDAALIQEVSPERVQAEVVAILATTPAAVPLRTMGAMTLQRYILPELRSLENVRQSWPHHYSNAREHAVATVSAVEGIHALLLGQTPALTPPVPSWAWTYLEKAIHPFTSRLLTYLEEEINVGLPRALLLKWAALYHDVGKTKTETVDDRGLVHFYGHEAVSAELTRERMEALHFPGKSTAFVTTLVAEHMRLIGLAKETPTRRATYRFYRATKTAGLGVVLLSLADALAVWGGRLEKGRWHSLLATAVDLIEAYFFEHATVVSPPPLLSGRDVMALGVEQGPEVGRLLEALREAQVAGEVTDRAAAEAFIKAVSSAGTKAAQ